MLAGLLKRMEQPKPTVVLCNRLGRIRNILNSSVRPSHWVVLSETLESRRITTYLRSSSDAHELDSSDLLRQRRDVFRRQYIQFIGELNQNNASLAWWSLTPTTKEPNASTLCFDVSAFLLIVDLMEQGYKHLLVVADSTHLVAQVKDWARHRDIDVKCLIKQGGLWRRLLKVYTPVPIVKASLITMYRWFWSRRLVPPRAGHDGHIVLVSPAHQASFPESGAGDGSSRYRDVYFEPLRKNLEGSARQALVMVLILGPLRQQVAQIKKLDTKIPVVPVEAFLNFPDILWCVIQSLWLSATRSRIKGELRVAGVEVGTLVRRTFLEAFRSGDRFVGLQFYRATMGLAGKVRVERFIYPFENRSWEKMMLQAMRNASPDTRLLGYQHAAITPSHLHFFLGEGEAKEMPLPDVILTAGELTRDWLQREGSYPQGMLRSACALRHQEVTMRRSRRKRGRVLVAMGNGLEEYVRTLIFLDGAFNGKSGRDNGDWQIVIRPHPNLHLPLEQALEQASISADYLYSISTGNLAEEVAETDVLVYASSTVALQAASAGIPTICLDLGRVLDTDPMWGWDAFKWRVADQKGLIDALEEIDGLSQDKFDALSQTARDYACSYLSPVTEPGTRIFLEA